MIDKIKTVDLETYGAYDLVTDECIPVTFTVPYDWLEKNIREQHGSYSSVEDFLDNYIWDETEIILMDYQTYLKNGRNKL